MTQDSASSHVCALEGLQTEAHSAAIASESIASVAVMKASIVTSVFPHDLHGGAGGRRQNVPVCFAKTDFMNAFLSLEKLP